MQDKSDSLSSLMLDTSILSLLLERNRKQHFRTQYFRRLDMLLRAMKRCRLFKLDDSNDNPALTVEELLKNIKIQQEEAQSLVARYKGIQKRRGRVEEEEEAWSLSHSNKSQMKQTLEFQSPFLKNIFDLHTAITKDLPEILSRIYHAASALYVELSRGYFLPFCTTALACISRIRILVMNLGKESVMQVQNSIRYLNTEFLSVVNEAGELEKTTKIRVSEARDLIHVCPVDPDLINRYMELHHDQYNKQMRQRKLKRVLSRTSSASNYSERVDPSVNTDMSNESLLDLKNDNDQDMPLDKNDLDPDQSIIGERMDHSHLNVTKEDDTRSNELDRNLELVSLLKKKSASKKRKDRDDSNSEESNAGKKHTISKVTINVDKAEKKPKKKSKKRNDGKCVIDDIFDGF